MENSLLYLVAAFGIVWLALLIYAIALSSRLASLRRDLAELERDN